MRSRARLSAVLAVALILGFMAGSPASRLWGADGPTRIRIATLAPKGTSVHQALQAMGEKWRQASGGSIELTIFTDGTMGGEADTVRRIRVGQLQAGLLTTIGLSEIEPAATALSNMPMMFRSLEEVDYIREKVTPELDKRFLEKGLIVLFWGDVGWVRFFSKEPMIHPADLKRMKVFTWAGDNNQVELMKAAGYQPVPLETGDILTGLQTGLISAVPAVPFVALAGQFYGPAPHMLEINWAPLVGGAVIAKKAWDVIPAATQAAFRKAADETGAELRQKTREEAAKSVEAMVKRGLNVHHSTPEIDAEWRKAAEDAYPKIRGGMVPADMFDQVVSLLKAYRASPGTKHE
jgi:TRAP-type transport system periplasmic protein